MTGGVVAAPARIANQSVAGGEESLFDRKGEPAIRDQIILEHIGLARATARKFLGTGEPLEDLVQEAITGLIGAVDKFDPKVGVKFSTYAIARMIGVIRHYLRDKCWTLKVPRPLQELGLAIAKAEKALSQKLGHSPTVLEIADHLEIDEDQVSEGIAVRGALKTDSLDRPVFHGDEMAYVKDFILDTDQENGERTNLQEAIASLNEREEEVICYRFWLEMSQDQVAERLDCSQQEISRIERIALSKIRRYFLNNDV